MYQTPSTTASSPQTCKLPALEEIQGLAAREEPSSAPLFDQLRDTLDQAGRLRVWRAEIPNIVFELCESPHQVVQMAYYYRRAGEDGSCYASLRTIGEDCGYGKDKAGQTRQELEELGLIECETRAESGTYRVRLVNVWAENYVYFETGGEEIADLVAPLEVDPPRKYYTQIPNVLFEMDLTVYELRLYLELARREGVGGDWCHASGRTLAASCGVSEPTISRAKNGLAEKGLLETRVRPNPRLAHPSRLEPIWMDNWLRFATASTERLQQVLARVADRLSEIDSVPNEVDRRLSEIDKRSNPSKNNPRRSENAREEESNTPSRPSLEDLVQFVQNREPYCRQFGSEEAKRAARKFRYRCQSSGWRVNGSPLICWQPHFESWLREWHRRERKKSDRHRSRGGNATEWMDAAEVERHAQQHGLTARGPNYEHNGKSGREARWKYVPEGQAAT